MHEFYSKSGHPGNYKYKFTFAECVITFDSYQERVAKVKISQSCHIPQRRCLPACGTQRLSIDSPPDMYMVMQTVFLQIAKIFPEANVSNVI